MNEQLMSIDINELIRLSREFNDSAYGLGDSQEKFDALIKSLKEAFGDKYELFAKVFIHVCGADLYDWMYNLEETKL